MMGNSVTIIDNRSGKKIDLPILEGNRGTPVIDIKDLNKELGLFTFDNGFSSTAHCKSELSFIDGEKGELFYRGYRIADIAEKKSYLDVCYLLLTGEFPNEKNSLEFDMLIRKRYFLHETLKELFRAFPENSHPMATLSSGVAALSSFYREHLDLCDNKKCGTFDYFIMAQRIISKIPTIAAYSYRHSKGLSLVYPDANRYFTENFLYMLRAYPNGDAEIKDIEVKSLDTIFTLHADHGQNASTTAVRTVCSTGAHPYAAISAGIGALWGRAHGGANEQVLNQLREISDSGNDIKKFIDRAKDPNDDFRLMGFGHRVYKNYDPRAKSLKELQDKLKNEINIDNKLLEVAYRLEEIALSDDYFIERKLYPNVDFYSGIILTALKIPISMFTPVFVIGRSVGWIAQWFEHRHDPSMRIARPRQLYIGKVDRKIEDN